MIVSYNLALKKNGDLMGYLDYMHVGGLVNVVIRLIYFDALHAVLLSSCCYHFY